MGKTRSKCKKCGKWIKSKRFVRHGIWLGFGTAFLYAIVLVLSIYMHAVDEEESYAGIRQALEDWSAKSWIDFSWSATDQCPEGYEAITSTWPGTYAFNVTSDNRISDIDADGSLAAYEHDYPAIEKVE